MAGLWTPWLKPWPSCGDGRTTAESIALAAVSALAGGVVVPYALDFLGVGVVAPMTATVSAAIAVAVLLSSKPTVRSPAEVVVFGLALATTFATLLWLARPELLPPGSGPDLTHHLLLVDYIQQHGTLVHDPDAGAAIGEMAQYTPGLHVLTVVTAATVGLDPFFVLYPLVAIAIALKFGVFALCVLRLVDQHPAREPFAIAGTAGLFCLSPFTFGSIVHDSFFAQAVAELFALTMWWAVIVWDRRPSWWPIATFAVCGAATFLTWPIWIGPPVFAFALLLIVRSDLEARTRLVYFCGGVAPAAVAAAVHSLGRTAGLGLAATSGAVSVPRLTDLGWWLPAVAMAALALSTKSAGRRPLFAFSAALGAQSLALWWLASVRGASTPYMALKMMYLAVYPLVAAIVVAISRKTWSRGWSSAIVLVVVLVGARQIGSLPRPNPTVSRDLWTAAVWARERAPSACIDYLVGNEYTAYWLHLAVLRNRRSDARSTASSTYETQAAIARWLVDDTGPTHAVARLSVVPREIRDRVQMLYRSGDAAVLVRPGRCAAAPHGD